MSKQYKNEDLRDMFGLSHETIRRYSLDFLEFLSEGANPEEGKHRAYDESDLRVFALIASMKTANHSNEDIKATLKAGLEGRLSEVGATLSPTIERTLARQEIANLQRAVEQANERTQEAETQAQIWRDKAKQYEGELKQLKERLESQGDIIALHKEIARLTVLLELAKGKSE